MISGLSGKILKKELSYLDILTPGGVIYRVFISVTCYSLIKNDEVLIHTTHIVREDGQALYGFMDIYEQKMFGMLLKVNGVGPKVAMAICSTFTPGVFARIIEEKDITSLKRVPGIGPKGAGVILVQLGGFVVDTEERSPASRAFEEAAMALEALGFKKEAVQKTLSQCKANDTESLVKEALRYFQK
jgi:Holliday junction DNA helicase RuvA